MSAHFGLSTWASAGLLLASIVVGSACGGDDDDGPKDWEELEVPSTTTPEDGIRREIFRVPGSTPPANPDSGETTPPELNYSDVIRYREDSATPVPARAIVIAYPGLLGGGSSFELLARHIVRRGIDSGEPIEVWAIDRRANGLEDLKGLNTAEAAGNPEIAQGYYFGGDTIDGESFPGVVMAGDIGYMSEWGLATHIDDLVNVIALIPEASRRDHLFLMGHSMGAWFAEAYAAWRFDDGSRGVEELAGIVLVDGLLHEEPLTEDEYHEGTSGGFLSFAGIGEIRSGSRRYFELPFFGSEVLPRMEVLLMRALVDPEAVIEDEGRDRTLRLLLQLGSEPVPKMTNAAAVGFGLDDGSCSLFLVAISCGKPTGGSTEDYHNVIADETMIRPNDAEATYAWIDATDADSDEFTPIANIAHSFIDGPTNFAEWYYPERLRLDLALAGGANLPEDGFAADSGLRVFDGLLNDAPILAIAAGLMEAEDYEVVRTRVAATVGSGRVNAGATRDTNAGFEIVDAAGFTHIDPLSASDRTGNPVPDAVVDFVYANIPAGTVTIPLQD